MWKGEWKFYALVWPGGVLLILALGLVGVVVLGWCGRT
jgi:hypothetical protein